MSQEKILVVEDDELMLDFMEEALTSHGYEVLLADDASAGLDLFKQRDPSLIIADIKMPGQSGIDFLSNVRELDEQVPVVMMTAYAETDTAIEALRNMADDFIKKPFEAPDVLEAVERHIKRGAESRETIDGYQPVYVSDAMENVVEWAREVAQQSGPVLIEGESGVGKEIIARFIHYQSQRNQNPLVTVNCGAIPRDLLESELFGHVKGAYTGAEESREGLFLAADSGTLFLDEIGELPAELQSKLLRSLETQEIKPVGSDMTKKVDVRIIAASNQNLRQAIEKEQFREDLFFRLNVFHREIPPLRERTEDVEPLLDHFLNKFSVDVQFSSGVMELLKDHPWPGNVRQLQNFVRRLQTLDPGTQISETVVEETGLILSDQSGESFEAIDYPPTPDLETVVNDLKRRYIERALEDTNGNKSQAAEKLGMNRTTLIETMKRMEIADAGG